MDSVENIGNLLRTLTCFNFYRGWRGISEYYRHYLPDGISAQQSYILELCDESSGVDVGTLAKQLEIDSPAISSMLRRMEASDLIRREVMSSNRRRTLVFLTPAGNAIRDQIRTQASIADKALLKHISSAESAQLACIVEKIFEAIAERDHTCATRQHPVHNHALPDFDDVDDTGVDRLTLGKLSKADYQGTLNMPA
jgi:DNA-binding MarR family transcriptional regulator